MLSPTSITNSDPSDVFIILRSLGRGSFGTVWLAAAGGAHPTVGEPSAAAVALTSHLKESAGPLAQLGAASPLLRTIGWTAA